MKPLNIKRFFILLSLFALMAISVVATPTAVTLKENFVSAEHQENDIEILEQADSSIVKNISEVAYKAELFNEEDFEDYLATRLRAFDTEIVITDYGFLYSNKAELSNAFGNTLRSNLDLYYVSFNYRFSYNSKKVITKIIPEYLVTDEDEIKATQDELDKRIDEIIGLTNNSMSDLDKLITVYNEIVLTSSYDHTLENKTGKALLLDGEAVCQGYASAFYAIASELGFEVGFVISEEMNHIWNSIYIDGSWYHIDVTAGDPFEKNSPEVDYGKFLKSDTYMTDTGVYYDFTELGNDATAIYDDYFWNRTVAPVIPLAGHMFFIDGSHSLYAEIATFNSHTGEISQVYSFENIWPSSSDGLYAWNATFSGLAYYNERLYFNTNNEILSCNIDGSDIKTEYALSNSSEKSIYGCCRENARIRFVVSSIETPTSEQVLYIDLPLNSAFVNIEEEKSMRIGEITGMRFKACFEQQAQPSAFGWIATRNYLLEIADIDCSEFTLDSSVTKLTGYNYGNGVEKAKIYSQDDENAYFTAVIYFSTVEDDGYPSVEKLAEKFVARPFAVVDGETIYGDCSEPTSIYDVAYEIYHSESFSSLDEDAKKYVFGVIEKVEMIENAE